MRILITGSSGLIGTKMVQACVDYGYEVVPFDIVRPNSIGTENICDAALLAAQALQCDGIVHLAAISRVAWGEERPG